MTPNTHTAVLILVMALVTVILRFLPFLVFRDPAKTPGWVTYLGEVLPGAIIGMLVIYCLRTVAFTVKPFGLPEIIAGMIVAGLQFWKNNAILSIIGGTVIYMLLVQLVFV